jgi:hypothetical protein
MYFSQLFFHHFGLSPLEVREDKLRQPGDVDADGARWAEASPGVDRRAPGSRAAFSLLLRHEAVSSIDCFNSGDGAIQSRVGLNYLI